MIRQFNGVFLIYFLMYFTDGEIKYFLESGKKKSSLTNDFTPLLLKLSAELEFLFVKKLEMLSLYSKNIKNIADVENAITIESKIDISKIFFQIFKKNNVLIKIFNKNIVSY